MQSSRHPLKPIMNQVNYRMNQEQNNYTNKTNKYDNENYDFDCDEQQNEYYDAKRRPYLDTANPTPSLFYTASRVAKRIKKAHQEEKVRKLKQDAIEERKKKI